MNLRVKLDSLFSKMIPLHFSMSLANAWKFLILLIIFFLRKELNESFVNLRSKSDLVFLVKVRTRKFTSCSWPGTECIASMILEIVVDLPVPGEARATIVAGASPLA